MDAHLGDLGGRACPIIEAFPGIAVIVFLRLLPKKREHVLR